MPSKSLFNNFNIQHFANFHNLESLFAAHQIYGKEFLTRFKASFEEKRWFEESMLAMFEETWQHPLIARYRDLVARMPTLPE